MSNEFAALKPVKSSMFSRAGYDEANWKLLLEFLSTKEIRSYKNVSPEAADEAMSAESLGKWFNANVKGNHSWEYDVLGADPSVIPEPPKAKPTEALQVIDEDIKLVEPGWNGHSIDPQPQMHITEIGNWPTYDFVAQADDFGVKEFDPQTGHWPSEAVNEDGTVKEEAITAIVRQPVGEVLGKWSVPESAAEALDLLAEREVEIKAIIAQNAETGAQALTVRVDTAEKRVAASETLNRLVAKKNTTTEALDPFRKVLYDAYTEAGAKVKSGVDPLEKGIAHVKKQILDWDSAQERIRQQKIREEREAAEAEARRQQAAEAERIRLADVQDALDEGDEAGAQMLFDAPPIEVPRPYVAPVYIPPAAPKIEGQSTSTTWKVDRELVESDETGQAYIASITALLKAVRDGKYPVDQAAPLLSWDFAAADKLAGALMGAFNVPGLSAKPVSTLRVGAGRKKK